MYYVIMNLEQLCMYVLNVCTACMMYVCMYVCMKDYMYHCIYVCMNACMYKCMYV